MRMIFLTLFYGDFLGIASIVAKLTHRIVIFYVSYKPHGDFWAVAQCGLYRKGGRGGRGGRFPTWRGRRKENAFRAIFVDKGRFCIAFVSDKWFVLNVKISGNVKLELVLDCYSVWLYNLHK